MSRPKRRKQNVVNQDLESIVETKIFKMQKNIKRQCWKNACKTKKA
jgi:hypothetical protein